MIRKNKIPQTTKKLLNRHIEKLINYDQKNGTFTPERSAIVDHIDFIMNIGKKPK